MYADNLDRHRDADENREQCSNLSVIIKKKLQSICNRNFILDRIPITKWLPKYDKKFIMLDIIAGLTVSLTTVPQSIAYAIVAGLEPQYGLYSAFMGCFVYCIFGSCKDIVIGPTAILALMVQTYTAQSTDFPITIAFLIGISILIFGICNLGFLVQFISIPVTIGFTSAAAITIASGQVKTIFGLPGRSNEFIEAWKTVFLNIQDAKLWDSVLGISTIIFLLLLRKLKNLKGKWKSVAKYISLLRNAMAVIIGMSISYYFHVRGMEPFELTGRIAYNFPTFKMPPFSTTIGNTTLHFTDMLSNLGTSLFTIPIVGTMELIAIAKVFSKGKTLNVNQELITLGLCNIFGSFVQAMPVTGSFTRTSINNASGVRTTLGSIYTGAVVLLSLGFLTQTFQFIPKATLAAVIISAVIFMVEIKQVYYIWKTRKLDILAYITTFLGCLGFGLEIGIMIGIFTNILILLRITSRPKIKYEIIKIANYEVLLITPDQSLVFSSAEYLKTKIINKSLMYDDKLLFIIVNGEFIQTIDFTVAKNLQLTCEDLKLQNKTILFWNWLNQPSRIAKRLNKDFAKCFIVNISIAGAIDYFKTQNMDDNVTQTDTA